jgi:hypothetical protein
MRRGVVAIAVVLTVALASAAQASGPKPRVSPGSGGRRTEFTVSMRVPSPAIREGGIDRRYSVSASGPSGSGCVSSDSVQVDNTGARSRVRVTLSANPGRWCRGVFHGQVTEFISPVCGPPIRTRVVCPMWLAAPRVIGRFRFRVR